jgi:hypothetical protein
MDADTSKPTPDVGGVGARRSGRASLADLRLIRRALLCAWPVSQSLKVKAVARLEGILDDDESGDRSAVAAVKTLVTMTGCNLGAIDAVIKVHGATELEARLDALEQAMAAEQALPGDENS